MDRSIRATLGLLLLAFLTLAGCSQKKESASVRLALPDWPRKESLSKTEAAGTFSGPQSLAVYENIGVIIINITGPGIAAPIYWSWERRDSTMLPPPSVEIPNIPRGSGRLVQALVVFEDSTTGSMEFHYGDVAADMNSELNPVAVTINAIGGSAGHGSISGRYLRADGSAPTGPVEIRFQAPLRPSMVVEREYIYGGWFNFFALPTTGFTYRLIPTGEVLFENYSTSSVTPIGTQQAKIIVPPYYYHNSWSNGVPVGARSLNATQTSVVGFFGAGATGKSVCFSNTVVPLENSYTSADVSNTATVSWVGNAALTATKAGVSAGGTATCGSAAQLFSSYVRIDETQVTRHKGILGFRGPFQLQAQNGGGTYKQEVLGSHDGSDVTLTWKYVTGATDAGGVRGASVFYRRGTMSSTDGRADYGDSDRIQCQLLASGSFGFSFLQDFEAGVGAVSASATVPGIAVSDFSGGLFQAVVCPYVRNVDGVREYIPGSAADFRAYPGGGGGGAMQPAIRLAAFKTENSVRTEATANSPATVRAATCVPIELVAVDNQGLQGSTSGTLTISVSSPAAGESVYNSPDCISGGDSTSVMAHMGRAYVYVMNGATSGTASLTLTPINGGSLSGGAAALTYAPSVAANALVTSAPANMRAFECFPVDYRTLGADIPAALSSPVSILFPSPDWQFYSTPGCNTAAETGMTFTSPATHGSRWVRYVGTASGALAISPVAANAAELTAAGATIPQATIYISQPNPAIKLGWAGLPQQLTAEQCYGLHVQLQDASGQGSPVRTTMLASGTSMTIDLSTNNGLFSLSPGCSTGTATLSTNIAEFNSFSNMVYFKPTVSGSLTLTAAASGLAGGVSVSSALAAMSVSAAVASRIDVRLPGQFWDSVIKMSLGSPFTLVKAQPYTIDLYALTPDGNLDPSFNGSAAAVNFRTHIGTNLEPMNFAISPWSGGHATATYKPLSGNVSFTISTGGGLSPLAENYVSFVQSFAADTFKPYVLPAFKATACQPVLIESASSLSVDSGSIPHSGVPVAVAVAATDLDGAPGESNSVQFYSSSDPGCLGAPTAGSGNVVFGAGESSKIIYIKTSGVAVGNIQLTTAATGFSPSITPGPFTTAIGTAGPESTWRMLGRIGFKRGQCHAVALMRSDSAGSAVSTDTDARAVSFIDVGGGGQFYSDPNCLSVAPSLAFAANTSTQVIYYRSDAEMTMMSFSLSETTGAATPATLTSNLPGSLQLYL